MKTNPNIRPLVDRLADLPQVERRARIEEIFAPKSTDKEILHWRAILATELGSRGLWPGSVRR